MSYSIKKLVLKFNGKYSNSYLYLPDEMEEKVPAVVLCHGNYYEGKDAKFIKKLSEHIVMQGTAVLSFDNLCYNSGWKPKNNVIESPEEIDLRWAAYSAITFLEKQDYIDKKRISIMGHSMGASIALAVAATDKRLCGVVSISPTRVSRFIFDDQKTEDFWNENVNKRLDTKISINTMRVMRGVLLEESYVNLLKDKKVFLIYGRRERFWGYDKWITGIRDAINQNSQLLDIPKAGHYYGVQPDKADEEVFESLAEKINEWLKKELI